jgi:hypothetical protein
MPPKSGTIDEGHSLLDALSRTVKSLRWFREKHSVIAED